jgi:hypothetical protein
MLPWIRPLRRTAVLLVGAAALSGCPDDRTPKPKTETTASIGADASVVSLRGTSSMFAER